MNKLYRWFVYLVPNWKNPRANPHPKITQGFPIREEFKNPRVFPRGIWQSSRNSPGIFSCYFRIRVFSIRVDSLNTIIFIGRLFNAFILFYLVAININFFYLFPVWWCTFGFSPWSFSPRCRFVEYSFYSWGLESLGWTSYETSSRKKEEETRQGIKYKQF